LLRFVTDSAGRLRPDALRRAPGRGVYVCPSLRCIRAAVKRGGFARGFRRKIVPTKPEDLAANIAGELKEQAGALARRALADGRARASEQDGEFERLLGEVQPLRVIEPGLRDVLTSLAEQMCRLRAELVPTGAMK
jgi:predicted RNA-binding protein YlxR (DUF448 family)